MAQIYELNYKREEGRYEPVDITAVLKQLQQGDYAEIDYSDVQFQAGVENLLTFEVRHEGLYNIAKVDVVKEALDRTDFDELIRNPVRVEVTAKPPTEAGKAPPPEVKAECEVRIGPTPSVVKVLHPAPEELPWPAKPEQKMPVELQLYRGSESKPLANTVVNLERKNPSDPPCGEWDAEGGPPKTTDEQGRLNLIFVPNELYYKPGGKYHEEYTVWTGEGDSRREIGALKFALAPRVKFRIEVEKKANFDEKEFGLTYEPKPVELELGPSLKIDALQIVPELPDDGQSSATRLPVAFAKLKILFLDKEDAETPAPGEPPQTDDKGLYTCKLPELTAAFTQPTVYNLKEHEQNPILKLNEAAEATIKGYRMRVEEHTPKDLLDGTLFQDLLEYRKTFCAQMAAREAEKYQTVEAASEILCRASTHTKLFNNMYNDQWGRMGDVLGNTLSDVLSLAVTLGSVGDKCIKEWAPGIATYFRDWIADLASRRWVRVIARYLRRKLNTGLRTIRGYMDDLLRWLGDNLPGTLQSIVTRGRTFFVELGGDIERLVMTTAPPESTAGEVLEAMKEWFTNVFQLIFRAVGNVLKILGEIVVGLCAAAIRLLGGFFAAARDALSPIMEDYIRPAFRAVGEHISNALGRAFTDGPHGYGNLTLPKMVEVAIAWLNEKWAVTGTAGDLSGKGIVKSLGLMDLLADPVINGVRKDAEKLDVPSPHKPRTDLFRDFITAVGAVKHQDELDHAKIDEYTSHFDNLILCVELIIMLVVTLFSLGGSVVIAGIFTKVEIAFGAFKLAVIRLPQAIAVVALAFTIAFMYALGTTALTSQGAAAAAP